jgi:hypothetical protein
MSECREGERGRAGATASTFTTPHTGATRAVAEQCPMIATAYREDLSAEATSSPGS